MAIWQAWEGQAWGCRFLAPHRPVACLPQTVYPVPGDAGLVAHPSPGVNV